MMDEKKLAVIGLVIASIIWATSGVSYPLLLEEGIPLITIIWVMVLFRVISIWLIADYKHVKHELIKDKKEWFFVILNGLFAVGTPIFFIMALEFTKLSNAYFITYTAPIWVFVGAFILLGEKLNPKKLVGLLIAMIGLYLVASPESILSLDPGFVFAMLAALTYAGDIITTRELKDYNYHTVSLYTNAVTLVGITIVAVIFFTFPSFDHPILLLGVIAVLGLLRGVASDLYFIALEKLEASTASLITLSELFFVSIFAVVFLNQIPTQTEAIGYLLIFFSAAIIILRKSEIENFEYLIHLRRKH